MRFTVRFLKPTGITLQISVLLLLPMIIGLLNPFHVVLPRFILVSLGYFVFYAYFVPLIPLTPVLDFLGFPVVRECSWFCIFPEITALGYVLAVTIDALVFYLLASIFSAFMRGSRQRRLLAWILWVVTAGFLGMVYIGILLGGTRLKS